LPDHDITDTDLLDLILIIERLPKREHIVTKMRFDFSSNNEEVMTYKRVDDDLEVNRSIIDG